MPHIDYRSTSAGAVLHVENVALTAIAQQFGTPLYVYSQAQLLENFAAYQQICAQHNALVCYAVKANSNLAILNLLARQGAGFDIVSGGELLRVIAAGGDPHKVIFSGVGKTRAEMQRALTHDILCFNVESIAELQRLNAVAASMNKIAPISLRINPDVDPKTHPYIATGLKNNKFGIAFDAALPAYQIALDCPHLHIVGVDCHIGSQLLDDAPLLAALDKLIDICDALAQRGIAIRHLDLGGGIGIAYGHADAAEKPIMVQDYLTRVFTKIDAWRKQQSLAAPIQILLEPGRSIVGNAGMLLTTVEFLKPGVEKNFAIVDAAMNDLMRPTLYQAWMDVQQVQKRSAPVSTYDIVGPICESGDWLARDRQLALIEGDLLAITCAGAYGMTMASNYNTRGRPAEVLIDRDQIHLIREREAVADLFALEHLVEQVEK